MPAPGQVLQQAIADHEQAKAALRVYNNALDTAVQPYLSRCKTVEDYHRLIDMLPSSYPGVRRMYEAIIRLEEAEEAKEHAT